MSQPLPQSNATPNANAYPAPADASSSVSPAAPISPVVSAKWLAAVMPVILIAACAELGISVLNNSALPIYFMTGLKIMPGVYGFLMVPFFISEVLFKSPLGILSDKFGRRPLMLGGAAVSVFTPLILISTHYDPLATTAVITLLVFGFLRAVDGLGQAALWPALYAYVGDVVEEKKRGAAMGALNVVYMLGLALSFLVGGFVDDHFGKLFTHQATLGDTIHGLGHSVTSGLHSVGHGIHGALHRPLGHAHLPHPLAALPAGPPPVPPSHQPGYYYPSFILASVLFGIAVIASLGVRARASRLSSSEAHPDAHEETITWDGFAAALRTVPQFLALAFVTFLGIGCISLLVKKFALDEYGLSESAFGLLVLGPMLGIAAIAVPAGHLADTWGKTRCVRLGFLLCALGIWGIPVLHHFGAGIAGFMVASGILGAGFVLAFPAWLALLTSIGGERQRGTVFAAVSTAQGAGLLLGGLVGTQVYGRISHIAPFIAASVLVSAGTLLALIFVREGALVHQDGAEKT